MQVGTTKDQGLYNKPSAAVHPGALAAGTLPHYNAIISVNPDRSYIQRYIFYLFFMILTQCVKTDCKLQR